MIDIQAQQAVLEFTLTITRADTKEVETYKMIGIPEKSMENK